MSAEGVIEHGDVRRIIRRKIKVDEVIGSLELDVIGVDLEGHPNRHLAERLAALYDRADHSFYYRPPVFADAVDGSFTTMLRSLPVHKLTYQRQLDRVRKMAETLMARPTPTSA